MTLYGDDHNKISVPFVRPEDENLFKNLCTTYIPVEESGMRASTSSLPQSKPKAETAPATVSSALRGDPTQAEGSQPFKSDQQHVSPTGGQGSSSVTTTSDIDGSNQSSNRRKSEHNTNPIDSAKAHFAEAPPRGPDITGDINPADAPSQEPAGGIRGSWRSTAGGSENGESTSGYQRPTRGASGRNMKVLKPSKSSSSATAVAPSRSSSSSTRTGASYEPAPSRTSGEARRKSQQAGTENIPMRWDAKRNSSEDHKAPKSVATLSKTSNPVGGASAFAWMNPGKSRTSSSTD